MAFALPFTDQELAIGSPKNGEDRTRMGQFIGDKMIAQGDDDQGMVELGDLRHGDEPPRKLVEIAFLSFDELKILQRHLAAMIVGADLRLAFRDGEHGISSSARTRS